MNRIEIIAKARCDGCRECYWIAPGGQPNDPSPHMRCRVLGRVEVVARKTGDYDYTLIPRGCPVHAQQSLFSSESTA